MRRMTSFQRMSSFLKLAIHHPFLKKPHQKFSFIDLTFVFISLSAGFSRSHLAAQPACHKRFVFSMFPSFMSRSFLDLPYNIWRCLHKSIKYPFEILNKECCVSKGKEFENKESGALWNLLGSHRSRKRPCDYELMYLQGQAGSPK